MSSRTHSEKSSDGRRLQKVERELREVIALFLSMDLKDELSGLVTVSRVEVSKDLKYAKVYVSVYGSKVEAKESMETLEGAALEIQHRVNKSIRMKYAPKLTFIHDDKAERVFQVQKLLHEMNVKGSDESED